jgi:hypothetical protein
MAQSGQKSTGKSTKQQPSKGNTTPAKQQKPQKKGGK